MIQPVKTPWHLWAIGLASLIWNGFGGWDYTQTQLRNREYIASMTEPMGIPVDDAMAYYAAFPFYADALWALGVWGSVAGSLLLLMRSRFAFHAFALSLVGLVGGMFYQFANPMPGLMDTATPMIFTAVILAIILALIYYSRRMTVAGVLR